MLTMDINAVSKYSEGIYSGLVSPDNDVYSTVGQATDNTPGVQHRAMTETRACPCRLAVACLGLLCVLQWTAIIALCINYDRMGENHFTSPNVSVKQRDFEQLTASYSTLCKERDLLQRNYTVVLRKLHSLDKYCHCSTKEQVCSPCPQGWVVFRSSCYYFSTAKKSWTESQSECVKQGAGLVIIESEEEQEFINTHTTEEYYWIGLNKLNEEGTWIWVDGSPLTKEFWMPQQPDNQYSTRYQQAQPADCAASVSTYNGWIDTNCEFNLSVVCESEALLP